MIPHKNAKEIDMCPPLDGEQSQWCATMFFFLASIFFVFAKMAKGGGSRSVANMVSHDDVSWGAVYGARF